MEKIKTQNKLVFSYGTLIDKFPDAVIDSGELCAKFELDDNGMFPVIKPSDITHTISGYIMRLTPLELKLADEYEDSLYKRTELTIALDSGYKVQAEVYVEV